MIGAIAMALQLRKVDLMLDRLGMFVLFVQRRFYTRLRRGRISREMYHVDNIIGYYVLLATVDYILILIHELPSHLTIVHNFTSIYLYSDIP